MMDLVALGAGYLLGSIPFGIVIARMMGLGDLRQIGSGNIGATNVLRTGNKGAALATLILDAAKGGIAVLLASWLISDLAGALAGLGAFVGHLYPVWLKFKGGKGVATFLGILLAFSPAAGLATCLSWLAVAATCRISSASALVSSVVAPVWLLAADQGQAVWVAGVMSALIWWRHRENIARLRDGTEPMIRLRRSA